MNLIQFISHIAKLPGYGDCGCMLRVLSYSLFYLIDPTLPFKNSSCYFNVFVSCITLETTEAVNMTPSFLKNPSFVSLDLAN